MRWMARVGLGGLLSLLVIAGVAAAAEPELKPGIPGLKMADVRGFKHLERELEELQSWEQSNRLTVAEYRQKVVEKTGQFLGFEGPAAETFERISREAVAQVRNAFRQDRSSDVDPSSAESRFAAELPSAVARITAQLRKEPRHELFAPECKSWLLRLAFGPSEAKEAREAAKQASSAVSGS